MPLTDRAIIIRDVEVYQLHSWQLSIARATQIQRELANQVSKTSELSNPHLIAGTDISAPDPTGIARAAVVVLRYPELETVEVKIVEGKLSFPYIPGLLSFREAPLVLAACQKLSTSPDLFLVDGQGIAHPRRLGLASHLGLFLNTPAIGCAKSRLCGRHEALAVEAGSCTDLVDHDEIIGSVVRTKVKVKPVYVSIGHKVDQPTSIYYTIKCCHGYRLPEPCRLAHLAASGKSQDYQNKVFQRKLL